MPIKPIVSAQMEILKTYKELQGKEFYVVIPDGRLLDPTLPCFDSEMHEKSIEVADLSIQANIIEGATNPYIVFSSKISELADSEKARLKNLGFAAEDHDLLYIKDIARLLREREYSTLKSISIGTETVCVRYFEDGANGQYKNNNIIPLALIGKFEFYKLSEIYNEDFPSLNDVTNHLNSSSNSTQKI